MAIQTIYWRRRHSFPAASIGDVAVVRGERWEAAPLERDEPHDLGWHRLNIDRDGGAEVVCDIWGPLGLCGEITDPVAIADAVVIAAAIMAETGIAPPMPDDMVHDCPWKPTDVDRGGTEELPSDEYAALQSACAMTYDELREALAERHGIEITPLAAW